MDLMPGIESVVLEERLSSKTNKPYKMFVVKFVNGYTMEQFPTNEQRFILEQIARENA